jgi:hypothetical protein
MMTLLSACSLLGDPSVEISQYKTLVVDEDFEIRHYESIILVGTSMPGGMDGQNSAFYRLFGYISGENENEQKIEMTAPVFMGMDDEEYMQFVLPSRYTMKTAPIPSEKDVNLHEVKDLTVALITFNGRLTKEKVNEHRLLLEAWIAENKDIEKEGKPIAAGYNPPFTFPALRRNEVLIPIRIL